MIDRIEEDRLAKIVWEFHHVHHQLAPADIICCFTSFDLSVPEYVAQLYLRGLAPFILVSGQNASGGLQRTDWGMTEADKFAEVMVKNGVPRDKIVLEKESVNSGENVRFSYELLKSMGRIPQKIIVAQKPTMEKRAYATFRNFWPEENYELMVTSPPFSYEEYVGTIVDRETMINVMVGDLQRIKLYPAMGFQIPLEIPASVWDAYEKLVAGGFDKHLVR
ncbi:MAG: YdcF family protein [Terracidiphilus sp.]|jgi:uncharacterized SAM-binding protein YcdF (DUF218 family)